jgi:quercetin dioxygenase-like cupin family protein
MKKLLLVVCVMLIAGISFGYDSKDIIVEKLVQSTKSWNGSELPKYNGSQAEVTILKITIKPGVKLPMHKHPVINAGVLIEGELTVVTKDGKNLVMKAGDPIVEVVDTWHYGYVEGDKPAVIIVFYVGEKGQKLTVK